MRVDAGANGARAQVVGLLNIYNDLYHYTGQTRPRVGRCNCCIVEILCNNLYHYNILVLYINDVPATVNE